MRLVAFQVEDYRRFANATSIKIRSDLIALVGPNEAGKSSLLDALAHLHQEGAFAASEAPRRSSRSPRLSWIFELEREDKAALSEIFETRGIDRVTISKQSDGRFWAFSPRDPRRDVTQRRAAQRELDAGSELDAIVDADMDPDNEFTLALFGIVREILNQDDHTNLGAGDIEQIRQLASALRSLIHYDDGENVDARDPRDEQLGAMAVALDQAAAAESEQSPFEQCVSALEPRLPAIEVFTQPNRELASQYDLAEVADEPPSALDHLATLAGVNLRELRDAALAGRVADVTTAKNAGNRRLEEVFAESWTQDDIAVQLEMQGTILHVQATTPSDEGVSDIAERSEGMRWFAALLAFTHHRTDRPILLVDEIETHLHYDAQADLIDVLSQQEFASKIVYTTHSFGCLPHDLGTNVRVVEPIDSGTSRLENGFWKRGAGFSPLLASMGAAALSFTPTRHAVIAEGPSDAILLPTLLRAVTRQRRLGFQVAPGLSSVAAANASDLQAEAGRVAFLVDGDEGGKRLVDKLLSDGVSEDRIVTLGIGFEIEDLVDAQVYVSAVNDELSLWQGPHLELTSTDIGHSLRTKKLEKWCSAHGLGPPDKTAVAQRVVDLADGSDIHDLSQTDELKRVLKELRNVLRLRATQSRRKRAGQPSATEG